MRHICDHRALKIADGKNLRNVNTWRSASLAAQKWRLLATTSSVLALAAGLLAASPNRAMAEDECGVEAADVDTVNCTDATYPAGIFYSGSDGLILNLNNPAMTFTKAAGEPAVSIVGAAGNANDLVLHAISVDSVTGIVGTGRAALSVINTGDGNAGIAIEAGRYTSDLQTVVARVDGGSGEAEIVVNGGTIITTGNTNVGRAIFATTGLTGTGAASVVINTGTIHGLGVATAGQTSLIETVVENTQSTADSTIEIHGGAILTHSSAQAVMVRNAGSGDALINMTGGSVTADTVSTATGLGAFASGAGDAGVRLEGGTVTGEASGITAARLGAPGGDAIVEIAGGSVLVTGNGGRAVILNNAGGEAILHMTAGTVNALAAPIGATGIEVSAASYDVEILGGTVNGGSGVNGTGINLLSGSGELLIERDAVINAGLAAEVAIREGSGSADIITSGTINGNVVFGTGNDGLELRAGFAINGIVDATADGAKTLVLGGAEAATFNVAEIGVAQKYQGFDLIEKRGSSTWTLTGTTILGEATPWDIHEGTLLLSDANFDGPVDLIGGVLSGEGVVGPLNHGANGIVAPGINGIGTLVADGGYVGNNGILAIETELGGDDSDTDLLMVSGGTSGSTRVQVTNLGGTGAETEEGIKIVDVLSGPSDGQFNLLGDAVVNGNQAVLAGAYAYSLFQGGISTPDDGDWYLRSIGFTPSATAYESYPGVLLGLIDMPSMQQRVGNVYMPNAGSATDGYVNPEPVADVVEAAPTLPPANFWTRFEAAWGHHEGDSDSGTEYDLDRYRVQVGIDGRLGESADGIFIVGINAQYGHADADLESDTGNGDNSTDSFGGGVTLTWVNTSGFYADAQGQVHYLESDLSSDALGDLVDNNEGWGYGVSLELGRKLALDDAWSITPQAQLAYTSVDFDDFTDEQGVDVSLDDGESLKGRLGLALNYDSFGDGDTRGHLYTIANLTYEFLDAQSVDIAGVNIEFEPEEFGGELGLGGTYEWSGGQHAIHAEALGQTSFEGSYGVKGNIGFSTKF